MFCAGSLMTLPVLLQRLSLVHDRDCGLLFLFARRDQRGPDEAGTEGHETRGEGVARCLLAHGGGRGLRGVTHRGHRRLPDRGS